MRTECGPERANQPAGSSTNEAETYGASEDGQRETPATVAETLIAGATLWRDAGYNVIPTHPGGSKRPFGNWTAYQTAQYPAQKLEAQVRSGEASGIGIITGAISGNRVMLEIEGPKPYLKNPHTTPERLKAVEAIATKYGAVDLLNRVIKGCSEVSGGEGLHMFARILGTVHASEKLAMAETTDEYQQAEADKARAKLRAEGKDDSRIKAEQFRWATVAETKEDRAFVVVAPSTGREGHAPGSSYRLIPGTSPATTASITDDERDLIAVILHEALNEQPGFKPETVRRVRDKQVSDQIDDSDSGDFWSHFDRPSRNWTGTSTFDDYRQRVTWAEILEPAGWTWSRRDDKGDYWVRPGKDKSEGHSAVTHGEDGALVNWSSSAPLPVSVPGNTIGLSKPQVIAYLDHGGDMSAAARALHAAGYGDRQLSNVTEVNDDVGEQSGDPDRASTWVPVDLAAIINGTAEQQQPTLMPRTDGICLLYRGKVHSFHGESESGKSLLAQYAAVTTITGGGSVLYIDGEDSPQGIVHRLKALGASDTDIVTHVTYINPDNKHTGSQIDANAFSQLLANTYDLVILDGVTNLLALYGTSSNSADEYSAWFTNLPDRIAIRTGAAVVLIDHVAKDRETRGRHAVGSQHKMNALTGSAYVIEVVQAIAPGLVGTITMRVGKDRPGVVRANSGPFRKSDRTQETARVTVDGTAPTTVITVNPHTSGDDSDSSGLQSGFRPTTLMERISNYLESQAEPVSGYTVRQEVTGNTAAKTEALKRLADEGYVTVNCGPRNAMTYTSDRPYRASLDPQSDTYAGATIDGDSVEEQVRGDNVFSAPQTRPVPVPGTSTGEQVEQVDLPSDLFSGTGREQVRNRSEQVDGRASTTPIHGCAGTTCTVPGCAEGGAR